MFVFSHAPAASGGAFSGGRTGDMTGAAFECRMCGRCCEGRGGIVLSSKDRSRLCEALGLDEDELAARHAERVNGKWRLRCGDDGFCVFFVAGQGCSVHEHKPDVCRAWPFFRGNILDAESHFLAGQFCPGVNSDVDHAEFARQGREYLSRNGLAASDRASEANALILDDER